MANPTVTRFTWHECMTTDAVAATKFYTGLFGWTVQEMPTPQGTYRIFMKGERGIGGCMTAQGGAPSHWLPYVGIDDCDATAKKAAELGGKIFVPPTSVPDMVRFAIAADPQGAVFGVVQPLGPQPNPIDYDAPPTPGTFCWDELHTKDLNAAAKYYGALFGWTGKASEGAMPYWHWKSTDKDIGGMMTLMQPNVPPNWLPYVAMSDVDAGTAKVKDLGGKVVMPAMDVEKVGKFSIVQDPTGATFALFRSARV